MYIKFVLHGHIKVFDNESNVMIQTQYYMNIQVDESSQGLQSVDMSGQSNEPVNHYIVTSDGTV